MKWSHFTGIQNLENRLLRMMMITDRKQSESPRSMVVARVIAAVSTFILYFFRRVVA